MPHRTIPALDVATTTARPQTARRSTDLAGGRPFIGAEQVWSCDQARVEGRWNVAMLPATFGWALAWTLRRVDCRLLGGRLRMARALAHVSGLWSTIQPNNAVIGSPAHSEFLRLVLDRALDADPTLRYALGPTLVTRVAADAPDIVDVLPEHVLYCVPPGESFRFFEDRTLTLPADAALIHYVSSNHRDLLTGVTPHDVRFDQRQLFWRLAGQTERGRGQLPTSARAAA